MLSEAELLTLKDSYTLTLPLPNHAAARNRLLARGRAQDFQTLQQHYPAVPPKIQQKLSEGQQGSGWDAQLHSAACTALTNLGQTARSAEQLGLGAVHLVLQQLAAMFPGLSASNKPALQTQLLGLFEAVAAAFCDRPPDIGVARLMSMLWVQAAFVGDLSSCF
jgi:hypothetical protein